jgi:hypothetical protein
MSRRLLWGTPVSTNPSQVITANVGDDIAQGAADMRLILESLGQDPASDTRCCANCGRSPARGSAVEAYELALTFAVPFYFLLCETCRDRPHAFDQIGLRVDALLRRN